MTDNQDRINQLPDKLEILLKRQDDISREINDLRIEIDRLKTAGTKHVVEKEGANEGRAIDQTGFKAQSSPIDPTMRATKLVDDNTGESGQQQAGTVNRPPKVTLDVEKFIGENLINKIGIVITVIGVAIGMKYSIEHDLVNPLVRIILGYLTGLGLLGVGILLKKNYENYSAVLVSGAMAIMYFITYSGYSFYGLIPQVHAFALMVIFTVFTVIAAINYNRQVIALIGLVGAYAVPFLLSEGSGNVMTLFVYMAIINAGILVIAFRRYWKPLYYSSFGLTWLMYFTWYVSEYQTSEHFRVALVFLSVFFASFYLMFLAYKLLQKEKFEMNDVFLLLANSFIFYGIGFAILHNHPSGDRLLGLFTLFNAFVHCIISVIIYTQKLADRNLFYLVSGLVLVFTAIAAPVELDGNWVTLLWAGEAALLFWIGRTKNAPIYEQLSYLLMFLAFFSIVHDWGTVYEGYNPERPETRIAPILNINFLTSLLCIAAFGFINVINQSTKYPTLLTSKKGFPNLVSFAIPAILLVTLYYAFRIEIATYWNQLEKDLAVNPAGEGVYNLDMGRSIWIINYSLLFVSLLSFVNVRKIKNEQLGLVALGLSALAIAVFLVQGLYELTELTLQNQWSAFDFGLRYVSMAFVSMTLVASYLYIRQDFIGQEFKKAFDILLHATVLWVASSELIHWMETIGSAQSYKLGLSLLWGAYALLLIVLGIWKQKKHLRIGAILLFGVTLIKLFFYDISHLDTIAKTIVFVSLGILLLIISFLYNKYKHLISGGIEG